jgi:hypothetical protein
MDSDHLHSFEKQAEVLVVHQLDLLAQLENQMRAVRKTLTQIETLRGAKYRAGGELTNGERGDVLRTLSAQLTGIDSELQTQHESCVEMQRCIQEMRSSLGSFKHS